MLETSAGTGFELWDVLPTRWDQVGAYRIYRNDQFEALLSGLHEEEYSNCLMHAGRVAYARGDDSVFGPKCHARLSEWATASPFKDPVIGDSFQKAT